MTHTVSVPTRKKISWCFCNNRFAAGFSSWSAVARVALAAGWETETNSQVEQQQQLQPCVAQTVLWHFPPHLEMPLSLPTSLTLSEHALLPLAATDCHSQTSTHTDIHTSPHTTTSCALWIDNGVPVWTDRCFGWIETHQVRAHVPVSRECTMETERFLHFQEWRSFCFTTLGTGMFWSKRWTTLKRRENTSTDGPGLFLRTGIRASILSSPRSPSVSARLFSSFLPPSHPSCLSVHAPVSVSSARWWIDMLGMCWECSRGQGSTERRASCIFDFPSLLPVQSWCWTRVFPSHVCSVPSLKRRAWRGFPSQLIPVRRRLSLTHSLVVLRVASVCLCAEWREEWWRGSGVGGAAAAAAAARFNHRNKEGLRSNYAIS